MKLTENETPLTEPDKARLEALMQRVLDVAVPVIRPAYAFILLVDDTGMVHTNNISDKEGLGEALIEIGNELLDGIEPDRWLKARKQ